MRRIRILILLAALVMAAAAGLVRAARGVNAARDQVAFSVEHRYGDPAAARGLTVSTRSTYGNQLFWETACPLADPGQARTEFSFFSQPQSATDAGAVLNLWVELNGDLEQRTRGVRQALLETMEPGEERKVELRLGDFYDCYPMEVELQLPCPVQTEALEAAFRDFFQIPVLEGEQLSYRVRMNENGVASSFGWTSGLTDWYSFDPRYVLTQDACYFTIRGSSVEGELIDTSRIPGGYGLYRLPYDETGPRLEELSMVYPLDQTDEVADLTVSPEEGKLLIHTLRQGRYLLTVLDLPSLSLLQQLELAGGTRGEYSLLQGEGCMVLCAFDGAGDRLTLVTGSDDTDYQVRFTVPAQAARLSARSWWDPTAIAWDGERLAVAGVLMGENPNQLECGFYAAVYTEQGMAYCGTYGSNLDQWDEGLDPDLWCSYAYEEPIGAAWNPPSGQEGAMGGANA